MIKFTKMQAGGNDFIIIDKEKKEDFSQVAKAICSRRFGVGADGLLVYEKSEIPVMNYFNADGSRAKICGNGLRCMAKYIYDNCYSQEKTFQIKTDAGIKRVEISEDVDGAVDKIYVNMGKANVLREGENLKALSQEFVGTAVEIGVPHIVIFTDDLWGINLDAIGGILEHNNSFEQGANIDFVRIINENHITIRTWERGVGHTLACGTGCCAAVIAGHLNKRLSSTVKVRTEGGKATVCLNEDETISIIGFASTICEGRF